MGAARVTNSDQKPADFLDDPADFGVKPHATWKPLTALPAPPDTDNPDDHRAWAQDWAQATNVRARAAEANLQHQVAAAIRRARTMTKNALAHHEERHRHTNPPPPAPWPTPPTDGEIAEALGWERHYLGGTLNGGRRASVADLVAVYEAARRLGLTVDIAVFPAWSNTADMYPPAPVADPD